MKKNILGIDASLRYTGLAQLVWDSQTEKISVVKCALLLNPKKYVKTEAILNMLALVDAESSTFADADEVIIESPIAHFNSSWGSGSLMPVCHIAGGACISFGLLRSRLIYPATWTGGRKKETTHEKTQKILGKIETWNFLRPVKNPTHHEHILDAASMALWYLTKNYVKEESEES